MKRGFTPLRNKFLTGFTLIELLLVIAIIGVITALSIAAMVAVRNQRRIDVVAEQIKNRIYQARSDAIAPTQAGVKDVSLKIEGNSQSKKLTITEESSPPVTIATDDWTANKNITFNYPNGNSFDLRFITEDHNKIGQLSDNSDSSIKITDSSGKTVTIDVDKVTGRVTFK